MSTLFVGCGYLTICIRRITRNTLKCGKKVLYRLKSQRECNLLYRLLRIRQQELCVTQLQQHKIFCRRVSRIIAEYLTKPRIANVKLRSQYLQIYILQHLFLHYSLCTLHNLIQTVSRDALISHRKVDYAEHMCHNTTQKLLCRRSVG